MTKAIFESPFSVGDDVWVVFPVKERSMMTCSFCSGTSIIYSNDKVLSMICPRCNNGSVSSGILFSVFCGQIEYINIIQQFDSNNNIIMLGFAYINSTDNSGILEDHSFLFDHIFKAKEEAISYVTLMNNK